jgi:hypothetical protein
MAADPSVQETFHRAWIGRMTGARRDLLFRDVAKCIVVALAWPLEARDDRCLDGEAKRRLAGVGMTETTAMRSQDLLDIRR